MHLLPSIISFSPVLPALFLHYHCLSTSPYLHSLLLSFFPVCLSFSFSLSFSSVQTPPFSNSTFLHILSICLFPHSFSPLLSNLLPSLFPSYTPSASSPNTCPLSYAMPHTSFPSTLFFSHQSPLHCSGPPLTPLSLSSLEASSSANENLYRLHFSPC